MTEGKNSRLSKNHRPRRSEDETARLMLDEAVNRIIADGMHVALTHIGMEEIIATSRVSRATAYRRWPSRQDFLKDVLKETVRRTILSPETEAEITALATLVYSHVDDLRTAQGRRDLIVEGLRMAADADIRRIMKSPHWRTYLALSVTHQGLQESELRTAVGNELTATENRFTQARAEAFIQLKEMMGYRLTPPLSEPEGFAIFSSASGAMMTGILVRVLRDPTILDDRMSMRPFGTSREAQWSIPELQLVGVFLSYLEPDPEVVWNDDRINASLALFDTRLALARTLTENAAATPT